MTCVQGSAALLGSLALFALPACASDRSDSGEATSFTTSVGSETGGSSGDDGVRLDVASDETATGGACPDGDGGSGVGDEFSYIWIANSAEGTVSKIDTRAAVELARYRTGPGSDNPSRTSVNLYGDVAVVNRQGQSGSVTKIATREADCAGASSTGPGDVKAWGQDGCVLWHTPLGADGSYENGPRPVAWEGIEGACNKDVRLWVGWGDNAASTGTFQRLDGKSGDVLDEVVVPNWTYAVAPIGPYGGAVNQAGDFWVVGLAGPLIRIDGMSLAVDFYPRPASSWFYGISIDQTGSPWMGDLSGLSWTFHAQTKQFRQNSMAGARGRGLMVDRENRAWMPVHANPDGILGQCSLASIDVPSGSVLTNYPLPDCIEPVGVAIDVDGFVWVVDKNANKAFKFDPDAAAVVAEVGGLATPYTYSDMTGSGLDLVVHPPQG